MTKIAKKEIVDALALELGTTKKEAIETYNAVLKVLKEKLQPADVSLTLDGIGTLKTFVKPAHEIASALHGGKIIQVPERQKVKFKQSNGLYA